MQATSLIWLSRCPSEKGDNTAQPKAQERPSEGAEACAQSRQPDTKAMHLHYLGVRFSGRPDGSSFHS